jgi:lysophospholipase L1-like esterase
MLAILATVTACASKTSPSEVPPPPPMNSTIVYAAIAASDGAGVGASVPCLFADLPNCPNGTGYVYVAARALQAKGFTVTLTNPSVPTATVGRDFQDLGNQNGHLVVSNFIDNEAPFAPTNSTLITIFGGANDADVVTDAMGNGAGASDQTAYINTQIANFGVDYNKLISVLKSRAPSARIVALNLPNMAGMPKFANVSTQQRQALQRLSVGFTTTVINPLVSQGVLVVDMMCDPRAYQPVTYSSDGFHPSDTGYAWMAAEVVDAATTSYRAPHATCSQMTLVPG